jgi:hypothetical protein
VDGHLTEIHPEIGMATEEEPRGDGCQVTAAERPQLLVTNLMVASAMLSCLWQISERGSVPYSEVYLDAIRNAARSRSWFRVPVGECGFQVHNPAEAAPTGVPRPNYLGSLVTGVVTIVTNAIDEPV